jgi:DNA helicase-2/ATP-dependent DNA helicase PcrA
MFNDQQKAIIKEKSLKIAVMAGAGVGKSHTLVGRISEEIKNGVVPHRITVITFTNDACDVLKERLTKKGIDTEAMTVKTLHGFCYKIYSSYCEMNGHRKRKPLSKPDAAFSPTFWELTKSYRDLPNKNIKNYLAFISGCQLSRIKPEQYLAASNSKFKDFISLKKEAIKEKPLISRDEYNALMYFEYEAYKAKNMLLDFNDMINYAIENLQNCERTLNLYRRKIQSLFIDECQDTNALIIELLSLLVTEDMKVVMLGDLRQSIYSFINAVPENIVKYINDNNFTQLSLNINYRSSKTIIDSANKFIANYPEVNIGGDLQPSKDIPVSDVASYVSEDEMVEKNKIIHLIRDLKARGYQYKDIAILYRTNAQSMLLIDWVVSNNIPFVIKKESSSIFSRKEMREIFIYLKLFNMPEKCTVDDIRKISNIPSRFVPRTSFASIKDDEFGRSMLNGHYDHIKKLDILSSELARHYKAAKDLTLAQQIDYIGYNVGYIDHWTKTQSAESLFDISLYFNCLSSLVKEYDTYTKLVKQVNKIKKALKEKNDEEGLNFYSCHASKGLEFPIVILMGVCDRLYPFFRSKNERGKAGIDEEARIFYVASTRPIEHLYYSEIVGKFGRFNVDKSPFVSMTNRQLLEPYPMDEEKIEVKNGKIENKKI